MNFKDKYRQAKTHWLGTYGFWKIIIQVDN